MQIIKRQSNNVVIFAGDDLSLDQNGCRGVGWQFRNIDPSELTIETVESIPEQFVGGGWSHNDGVWTSNAIADQVILPAKRAEKIAQLIELELQLAKNEPLIIPLPQDPRLQQVCAALMKNPADNKTLYQWGVKYGASERTFSRLFNNELGLSFRQWRQLVRFHYAFELLAKNKSIKHVATACGYLSPSAFTAAFQQYSGHTPSNINF